MSDQSEIHTVPPDTPIQQNPRAFAIRISDTNIWLGNEGAAIPDNFEELNYNPDNVLTVSLQRTDTTTTHIPLYDGRVNDPSVFAEAVDEILKYLQTGEISLVHCAVGVSRSPCVIATAISAEREIEIEQSVNMIKKVRPHAQPHKKLLFNSYYYLSCEPDYDIDISTRLLDMYNELDFGERHASIDDFDITDRE